MSLVSVLLRPKMCEITLRGSLLGPVLHGVYSQVESLGLRGAGVRGVLGGGRFGGIVVG